VICAGIKQIKTTNLQGAAKRKVNQVSLLHDNARPQMGGICSGGVDCSTLSSLQSEFVISIFHLFGPLKDAP
jgi:asparagine synthetase B (glutamine-hydrolysing)